MAVFRITLLANEMALGAELFFKQHSDMLRYSLVRESFHSLSSSSFLILAFSSSLIA
jgi:hypothetical protein